LGKNSSDNLWGRQARGEEGGRGVDRKDTKAKDTKISAPGMGAIRREKMKFNVRIDDWIDGCPLYIRELEAQTLDEARTKVQDWYKRVAQVEWLLPCAVFPAGQPESIKSI